MASGPSISGIITAPIVPPLNDIAIARARRLAGNDSTAVRRPPGNVAPSPRPSSARAAANPAKLPMNACEALAPVHTATASSIPTRSPTKSSTDPHTGLPIVYARKKNDAASVKFCAVRPVSRMMVGARIVRTCRSTNESQEQRAMPMQGTHRRQSVARAVDVVDAATTGAADVAIGPPQTKVSVYFVAGAGSVAALTADLLLESH